MRILYFLLLGLLMCLLSGCSSSGIRVLVSGRYETSLHLLSEDAEPVSFYPASKKGPFNKIKSFGKEIFVLGNGRITVLDIEGKLQRVIEMPDKVGYAYNFSILPNGGFAILDNKDDKVYFLDAKGEYIRTINMIQQPNKHLQSTHGIVVGNQLVISEDGFNHIIQIDLNNYEVSELKDLSDLSGRLGAIGYCDGVYYICQSRKIYSFRERDDKPLFIAELPESNITGMDINGDTAFIVVNGLSNEGEKKRIGSVYKLNLVTGDYETVIGRLQYPKDIELLYQ